MWIQSRILDGVMAVVVRSYERSLFYLTFTISASPDCKAQRSILEHLFFFIRDSIQRGSPLGIVCKVAQKTKSLCFLITSIALHSIAGDAYSKWEKGKKKSLFHTVSLHVPCPADEKPSCPHALHSHMVMNESSSNISIVPSLRAYGKEMIHLCTPGTQLRCTLPKPNETTDR